MKYGIIADVHSNLEALCAVLYELEKEKIDKYIFLGDIIGYGANPNECVNILSNLDPILVLGNHDQAIIDKVNFHFNPYAEEAIDWTRKVLNEENKKFLHNFQLTIINDNFTLVHANPSDPLNWNYILSTEDARYNFFYFSSLICFVAHSHIPWIMGMNSENCLNLTNKSETYTLKSNFRYIVNVGSVGQPRDRDSRACYVIWDTEKQIVKIKRVEYDIKCAQRKIQDKGLPFFLATRLAHGI